MRQRHELPKTIVPDEEAQRLAHDRDMISTFTNVDFQRVRFWCLSASVAVEFPRRLGADASMKELSLDKKTSRKVCASYRELWRLMHLSQDFPEPPDWNNWPIVVIDPLMTRIGATVRWEQQVNYLIGVVERRMTLLTELEGIAVYDGMKRWYNRHDEMLDWELDALYRVQMHIETKRPTV